MRGIDGNETCPHCYQVMIELERFDARSDAISSGDDSTHISNYGWWESAIILDGIGRVIDKIKAFFLQRRLDRVLRSYPASLYCSGCGYILRRG
jgi:hypothetical protein